MASIAAKSTLFETPYLQTHQQWRTTLHKIKQLYIQRQYKSCVSQCSSILASVKEPIHPVYKVYIYFYSALCYEAMGRYAHEYSSKKVPLLREAKDCFGLALGALPGSVSVDMENNGNDAVDWSERHYTELFDLGLGYDNEVDGLMGMTSILPSRSVCRSPSPSPSSAGSEEGAMSRSRSTSGSTSPAESLITSITKIIDKTLDSTEDDPFVSGCEDAVNTDADIDIDEERNFLTSTSDTDSDPSFTKEGDLLVPPPLQVRKRPSPRPLIFKLPNFDGNDGSSTPSHFPTRAQTEPKSTQAYNQGQTPGIAVYPPPLPLSLPLPIRTAREGVQGFRPSTRFRTRNARPSLGPYSCSTLTQQNSCIPLRQGSIPKYPSRTPTEKYNASLTFLQTQISSTITTLHSNIQQ
ncbi:hypothetical protein BDV19DRAFT_2782 [Aspergillus venezuelensis]